MLIALTNVHLKYNVYPDEVLHRIPFSESTKAEMVQVISGIPPHKKEKYTKESALEYEEESKKLHTKPIPQDQDYYEILGVPVTASQEEIEQGHNNAMIRTVSDTAGMLRVDKAFRVLGLKSKRLEYDLEYGIHPPASSIDALNTQEKRDQYNAVYGIIKPNLQLDPLYGVKNPTFFEKSVGSSKIDANELYGDL